MLRNDLLEISNWHGNEELTMLTLFMTEKCFFLAATLLYIKKDYQEALQDKERPPSGVSAYLPRHLKGLSLCFQIIPIRGKKRLKVDAMVYF